MMIEEFYTLKSNLICRTLTPMEMDLVGATQKIEHFDDILDQV